MYFTLTIYGVGMITTYYVVGDNNYQVPGIINTVRMIVYRSIIG